MRNTTLTLVLLASSIAFTGCGGGGDGGGGGGTAGSGGSGGRAALSFNAETALPAMGGTAAVTAFAAQFGNTVASILEALVSAPGAASFAVTAKIDIPVSGFCSGGGSAVLDWNDADSDLTLSAGDEVTLELNECVGSAFAGAGVSGYMTLTVTDVSGGLPFIGGFISAVATLDLTILPGTTDTITGSFDAFVDVSIDFSMINLRLGNQLDDDSLIVSQGGQVLKLGCFRIVNRIPLGFVAPLGVASLASKVYTINDYAASAPPIGFNPNGVPSRGTMTLHSGDRSGRSSERSGACPGFGVEGDGSLITATFSSNGCIDLQGENPSFESSTRWDKLLAGDFTPGGGESCGGGGTGGSGGSTGPTSAEAPPVTCAQDPRWVVYADAYVRGGLEYQDTAYGNASNLLLKGDPGLNFARKTYLAFDVSSAPEGFTRATLVLTLDRHVDRQPVDLSGIIDNADWDPTALAEGAITWNNAPRNDLTNGVAFLDQGSGAGAGVRVLAPGYTFDREDVPGDPDPEGTQYGFDVTDFMLWAVGQNETFSSSSPEGDEDEMVTLLLALVAEGAADGSALDSKEVPDEEMCSRPFLHFE